MCYAGASRAPAPLRLLIHGSSSLMHELLDFPDPNLLGIELSGTLTEEDCDTFTSVLTDHFEQHTTTRALFVIKDVDGWEPEERWEELAFDIRHLRDLDKVAVVGDDLWETWLEKVEELFGPGSVPDPEATAQDEE
ncbi:MAG: STAS/SEC14 domain-containing protein [Bacteroidetes bacterium QH_2_63_10]|nr:MAG: STAS/SEC14 domain-containing protein [Bacteroidetes bacterium QH_2_63_10]